MSERISKQGLISSNSYSYICALSAVLVGHVKWWVIFCRAKTSRPIHIPWQRLLALSSLKWASLQKQLAFEEANYYPKKVLLLLAAILHSLQMLMPKKSLIQRRARATSTLRRAFQDEKLSSFLYSVSLFLSWKNFLGCWFFLQEQQYWNAHKNRIRLGLKRSKNRQQVATETHAKFDFIHLLDVKPFGLKQKSFWGCFKIA